jgi:DNA-binding XRE family transcriptional regulator
MTKHAIVYIGGQHDHFVLKGYRQQCLEYAKALGLGELKGEAYFEEVVPGPVLEECLSRAADGSVFITNAIASFGAKPSEQRRRILALLGRGVSVLVHGLGNIEQHLVALKAGWEASAPLEAELAQLQADYADHEAQLAERMERFEERLVSRLSELKGVAAVREYFGANGHSEPEVTDETALHVKQLREGKGWSQDQLATAAGTSKSQIQRIETSGKGTDLGKVLSVLEHGWKPETGTTWIEGSQ